MGGRLRHLRKLSILSALALAGCGGVLDPQGPVSAAERLLLFNATGIMLVVVLPVIVLTLAFAWWYRAGNHKAAYSPDWDYSGQIELVVWSIPAMIVILVAGVGWLGAHQLDPYRKLQSDVKPLTVQAVSMDWKWLFIYPEQRVATVNQLVVPAGTPINFQMTSFTVMNAFFIPQLGSMVYTMPGMTTQVSLKADRPGDYPGLSSHFSGDGFSDMHFVVRAVAPSDFDNWASSTKNGSAKLDDGVLATLEKSETIEPATYQTVGPSLFERIQQASTRSPGSPGTPRHDLKTPSQEN